MSVAAVVPFYHAGALELVADGALRHVGRLLLVDDGAAEEARARAAALTTDRRVELLSLGANHGKGHALAAGFAALLDGADPPDAILTLDADGQHPTDRIPAFLAARADVVIGRRRGWRRGGMPLVRRAANSVSSAALSVAAGRRMPDGQCGMRLLRAAALRSVPLEPGRFEAETRHLKALVRSGAIVEWVEIPAIYAGEPSAFRPLRDGARIGREILRAAPMRSRAGRRAAVRRPARASSTGR